MGHPLRIGRTTLLGRFHGLDIIPLALLSVGHFIMLLYLYFNLTLKICDIQILPRWTTWLQILDGLC